MCFLFDLFILDGISFFRTCYFGWNIARNFICVKIFTIFLSNVSCATSNRLKSHEKAEFWKNYDGLVMKIAKNFHNLNSYFVKPAIKFKPTRNIHHVVRWSKQETFDYFWEFLKNFDLNESELRRG